MARGRVVALNSDYVTSCNMVRGVKKSDQSKYNNDNRYRGGNGTYCSNIRTEPYVTMKVVLYKDENISEQHTATFSVRDDILDANPEWKKITAKRLDMLREKLVGNKIDIEVDPESQSVAFDSDIFIV